MDPTISIYRQPDGTVKKIGKTAANGWEYQFYYQEEKRKIIHSASLNHFKNRLYGEPPLLSKEEFSAICRQVAAIFFRLQQKRKRDSLQFGLGL